MNKTLLLSAALCASALSAFNPLSAAPSPPNCILILVDDLGWMDLSCQGSDYYKTPNIDRLAAEGVRFTNAYAACAVCSPTRSAVQTGKNPARVGVTDWIRALFQRGNLGTPDANPTEYVGIGNPKRKLLCPPNPFWMEHEEITIAEALKPLGYHTAYIGKWHLGDEAWYPTGQGYDVNIGGCDYGQPPSYFDPYNQPKHKHESIRNGIPFLPPRKEGEFLTHREGDEAEKLIRQWAADESPFFIQYAPYAVHTPIQAIPEVAANYKREDKSDANAKYAAMVESVDDAVGQILDTLQELKLEKDTFIIFTSDNGGLDNKGNPTENAPLRSGKGYAYEGGIRVPFLARWPGVIPEGLVLDTPVISMDIFPTVLTAAGGDLGEYPHDGRNLLNHLKSSGKDSIKRNQLVWHFPHYRHAPGPYSIIREDNLKLIKFWEGIYELYDLDTDPAESTNLADTNPEKVKSLEKSLTRLLKTYNAKLPKPNPDHKM